jgi:hypothetical protein
MGGAEDYIFGRTWPLPHAASLDDGAAMHTLLV